MKVLIAVSCLLAVASAGFISPYNVGYHYAHAEHVPVIGPNGVPLEPAENVAARAAHAAAHVEAKARNGDLALVAAAAPLAYTHGAYLAAAEHLPVIGPHGVPLEPAANVAARAQHAAAHVEAKARNGDLAYAAYAPTLGYAYGPAYGYAYHGAHAFPALAHDGQPLETPEVVAAKAHHFAAHAEARARNYVGYASPYLYGAYAAHAAGVPLDTPEVAAAKVAHFAAHAAATHGYHY